MTHDPATDPMPEDKRFPIHLILEERHRRQLEVNSGISPAIIEERGYRSIPLGSIYTWRKLTAPHLLHGDTLLKTILHEGALTFPSYQLGAQIHTWVLRPDAPRTDARGKKVKYEIPKNVGNVLDVLPRYKDALGDPNIPLWITEGAKKADALASRYGDLIVPVNENGVSGWRGTNGKGGKVVLADFEYIAWNGRTVVLAPDGDVRTNPNVMDAVKRQVRALVGRYKLAQIFILLLPGTIDGTEHGPKMGVDDYLAQGHTIAELEQHLVPFSTVLDTARTPIGVTEDGATLFLPAGYSVRAQTIMKDTRSGDVTEVYSGRIMVVETGRDIETGDESMVVEWNGRGNIHGSIRIPTNALSDTRLFSSTVHKAGASLGPDTIKPTMQFLSKFHTENSDVIPIIDHVSRLGLVESGLVLPAGSIGFDRPVRYSGRPLISGGADAAADPEAIRQAMVGWPTAWSFWLTLALGLVGPVIARVKPRRNPTMYIAGPPMGGKTTIAEFGVGCWGNPTVAPFLMQLGRFSAPGVLQTLAHLGGLPLLMDEAQLVDDPKRLALFVYMFANRQRHTIGSSEQVAKGGTELSGTLLLAGEAMVDLIWGGASDRVWYLDTNVHWPLGAAPRTRLGEERAMILERAWKTGAGLFGHAVMEVIWRDWDAFVAEAATLETDPALKPMLVSWRLPLALAAATLNVALRVAGVTDAPDSFRTLLSQWVQLLTQSKTDSDPARTAFERVVLLLTAQHRDDGAYDRESGPIGGEWEWIDSREGPPVAVRKSGDSFWRVSTATETFRRQIGSNTAQLFTQTWVDRGWILPGKDGGTTPMRYGPSGAAVRCLRVPLKAIRDWAGGDENEDE